jgi:hypothetical protein
VYGFVTVRHPTFLSRCSCNQCPDSSCHTYPLLRPEARYENTACTHHILPIPEYALTHSDMHVLIFRQILVQKGVLHVTGPQMFCSVYGKAYLQTLGRFLAHMTILGI